MDMDRTLERIAPKRRLGITLLAGAFVVASCSDSAERTASTDNLETTLPSVTATVETNPTENTPATTIDSTAETNEVPAEDCSFRYVQPGEHFNPEKSELISEDLDLLEKILTYGSVLELSDVCTSS
jgi:hypothetical protein